MKIPHTIPQFILRAFTRKLTPEQLEAQYEGRVLKSEDPDWDEKAVPTLVQVCLDLIVKDYPYYVRLNDEWNRVGLEEHAKARAEWETKAAAQKEHKLIIERQLLAKEMKHAMTESMAFAALGAPTDDSDSDEDDPNKATKNQLLQIVPDEFPEFVKSIPILDRLNDVDRMYVIEELDFEEIPHNIAFETIPDDHYWERCCDDRWPDLELGYDYPNWKTMYIERHMRNAIESFHPLNGNMKELEEEIELCYKYVKTLILHSLLPFCYGIPLKAISPDVFSADDTFVSAEDDVGYNENEYMIKLRKEKAEQRKKEKEMRARGEYPEDKIADEEEEEVEDPKPKDSNHVDLSLILPKLINLTKLSLVYTVAELGVDYEARYVEFTWKDCENLAKALALTPTIEIFELNKSKMSDEQTKLLVREGLLHMKHLKILNLSYNRLGCAGAKAIARLICDEDSRVCHTLHSLSLVRNQIRNPGAEAIAYALTHNNHLYFLDLRLNYIRNTGGSNIAHALAKNTSIQVLNLNANYLGPRACQIFGKMLRHNKTLVNLDLSSNELLPEGGSSLLDGIRECKQLLKLDVRMTKIGTDMEYEIMSKVRKNRKNSPHSYLEQDDVYPPTTESQIQLSEEEEEDEEEEEEDVEEEVEGSDDENGVKDRSTRISIFS